MQFPQRLLNISFTLDPRCRGAQRRFYSAFLAIQLSLSLSLALSLSVSLFLNSLSLSITPHNPTPRPLSGLRERLLCVPVCRPCCTFQHGLERRWGERTGALARRLACLLEWVGAHLGLVTADWASLEARREKTGCDLFVGRLRAE